MTVAWPTNRGRAEVAKQDPTAVTLRILLVDTAPASQAAAAAVNTIADVVANELSGTGYARQTLASVTITENDTDSRADIDADDPTWTGIDAGTAVGGWIARRVGASDATTDPVWCFVGCTPTVTNGGDFTLEFDPAGFLSLA